MASILTYISHYESSALFPIYIFNKQPHYRAKYSQRERANQFKQNILRTNIKFKVQIQIVELSNRNSNVNNLMLQTTCMDKTSKFSGSSTTNTGT